MLQSTLHPLWVRAFWLSDTLPFPLPLCCHKGSRAVRHRAHTMAHFGTCREGSKHACCGQGNMPASNTHVSIATLQHMHQHLPPNVLLKPVLMLLRALVPLGVTLFKQHSD